MLPVRKDIMQVVFSVLISAVLLASCGGGGGGGGGSTPPPPPTTTTQTPTSHIVNISWAANRESAVNTSGGGYVVTVSGQPPINVPYVSGPSAPTTTPVTLMSGNYSVSIQAYSSLNPPGGSAGSTSAASTALAFSVPY